MVSSLGVTGVSSEIKTDIGALVEQIPCSHRCSFVLVVLVFLNQNRPKDGWSVRRSDCEEVPL